MAQMVTFSHRLCSKTVVRAAGGRGSFNIGGKVFARPIAIFLIANFHFEDNEK